MNNREWLNGLSDYEFVKQYALVGCTHSNCHAVDNDCQRCRVAWLKEPHETTGHEDLVNAGWKLMFEDAESIKYMNANGNTFLWALIHKCTTQYKISDTYGYFYDDDIDFLRKCADKIRKEKGWV